jgi:cytochrome c oxidase subunit II
VKSNLIIRLVLIGVVLLIAGLAAQAFPWLPARASAEAAATDNLFNIMIVIGTIIFLIVEGALVYSILKFRRKPNDETDGPNMHGSVVLEVTWTVIPAIIVTYLSVASFQVFAQTLVPRDNEITIKVVGQQFVWSFGYPHDPNKQFRTSDTLVLPVNVPVRFELTAVDVMHGFWIPEFRIKQDNVPGRVTEVRALPTLKGDYSVVCYELCGSGHGLMRNAVRVVDQDVYEKFVADLEILPPERPLAGEHNAAWGKYLIQSNKYACAGCHYLPDAGIAGLTGPTWVGLADKADERVPTQPPRVYVQHSILYPNEYVVPGYPANLMPQNYGELMDDTDLESIVDYLLEQKTDPAQSAQTK